MDPKQMDVVNERSTTGNNNDAESGKCNKANKDYCLDKSPSEEDEIFDTGIWKWIIVIASFFSQFIAEGVAYTIGVFLVEIGDEFSSIGKSGVSVIGSILAGTYHVVGPVGSVLVNRYGARNVSIAGSAIGALGFAVSYFANGVIMLCFTIGIVSGLGLSLLYLPAMVIVARYFKEKRALAIGISVCGSGVGTLFFEFIIGILLRHFTWRKTMIITAGMILCAIPFSCLYSDRSANKKTGKSNTDTTDSNRTVYSEVISTTSQESKSETQRKIPRKRIFNFSMLKDKVFLLFAVCDIFMGFGYNVPYFYLPEIEQKMSNESSGYILGIIGVSSIVGRALTGLVGDYKWFNRHLAYSATLFLCGLLIIISPFLQTTILLRVNAALYGIFLGSYMTLKSINLVDILGISKLTDAYGMLLLFQAIGFLTGPPFAGFLHDQFGSYDGGFYCAGISISLGGVLLFFIPRVQRSVQKSQQKEMEITAPIPIYTIST